MAPDRAAGGGDLIRLGYRLTVNLTSDFAGIDRPLRTAEETERLIAITKKLSEGATMVHSTTRRRRHQSRGHGGDGRFRKRLLPTCSLARRRALIAACAAGEISEAELPRDVLTTLLMGNDALELEEHQILREIAFYMQAGAHSGAANANSSMRSTRSCTGQAMMPAARWARLDDAIFVQRCVHESLRLHPASPEALAQHDLLDACRGRGRTGVWRPS